MTAKKQSIGHTKTEDLSKGHFIKNVWQSAVNEQDWEIRKTLYGQSNKFRLNEEAKYLQVDIERWYSWTSNQKERYGILCPF